MDSWLLTFEAVTALLLSADQSTLHTPRLCPVSTPTLVQPVGAPSLLPGVRAGPVSTRHTFTSDAWVAQAKYVPSGDMRSWWFLVWLVLIVSTASLPPDGGKEKSLISVSLVQLSM